MHFAPIIICFAAISLAAPTNFLDDVYDWTEELSEFYGKVRQYIKNAKYNIRAPGACEVSKIALPSYALGLTSPSGLKPKYVALGRGTQNYTCADSTAKSTPTAIGAIARLYNATCIAANLPDLLANLPDLSYKTSLPTNEYASFLPANLELLGHHFFYDATTPEFNLNTTPKKQDGIVMTKKGGAIDAPSATDGTVGNYKSVYRVDTAAGLPPKTCKGMPAAFEMQYAANYFFFGSS
ncbi:hypothetical protein PDIDSM_6125 [Penicillium digitatum]|nr:hypothetical protein PDIDSM_6125 [Penicillium digitatum]